MGNLEASSSFLNSVFSKQQQKINNGTLCYIQNGQQAEIYKVRIPSENTNSVLALYEKRKARPGNMIRVFGYQKSNAFSCDSGQCFIVLTQRLFRLSKLNSFSQSQSLGVIKQILILYESLSSVFGPFLVTSEMIGKDMHGNIKLWINQNLGQNIVSDEYYDPQQNGIKVVRRVCQIISNKVVNGKKNIQFLFNNKKFDGYSIQKIVRVLCDMQISKKTHIRFQTNFPTNNLSSKYTNKYDTLGKQKNNIYFGRYTNNLIHKDFGKKLSLDLYSDISNTVEKFKSNSLQFSQTANFPVSKDYQSSLILAYPTTSNSLDNQSPNSKDQKLIDRPSLISTIPHSSLNSSIYEQPEQNQKISSTTKSINTLHTISPKQNFILGLNKTSKTTQVAPQSCQIPKILQISKAKQIQCQQVRQFSDMKLVKSHIFLTNQQLYYDVDRMVEDENIKVQQSAIIKRLSKKQSKVQ